MVLRERSSILATSLTAGFSVLGTGVMLFKVDPFKASLAAKIVFFAVSFLAVCSLFSLLIFFVWRFWSKRLPAEIVFTKSFWISLLAAAVLFSWLLIRLKF